MTKDVMAAKRQKLDQDRNAIIAEHGQAVLYIFGTPDEPITPFAYTVGNAETGRPELIVIGPLPPNVACHLLNDVGAVQRKLERALDEGLLDINWSAPVRIRKAGPRAQQEFTYQVGDRLGHQNYEVLQILVPDVHGKYAGEEGCDPAFDVELV